MKKPKAQLLTALIILAIAAIFFASCKSDGAAKDDGKTGGGDNATTGEIAPGETTELRDKLPDRDFGGYTFRVYTRGPADGADRNTQIYSEGENGDLINDVIYKRQKKIEDRFNINIDSIPYDYGDSSANAAQKSILAGDNAFDLLAVHGANMAAVAQKNLLVDWISAMPYVDFEAPWWPDDETKSMRLGGKLYFTIGELTYSNVWGASCLLFNKELFKNLNIDYPYSAVKGGTWTLDKFISTVKQGSFDLDGDGAITPENDRYGLEIYHDSVYPTCVFFCGGDKVITVHEGGRLELTAFNERTVSIFDKFFGMMGSKAAYVFYDAAKRTDFNRTAFREGRSLFWAGLVTHVITHRDLDIDIGILPCPKYDESTPRYFTSSYLGSQVFGVPVTSPDTERTSVVVEALSAEGYRMVKPVFYEEALKRKFSRDDESEDMLDYIRDGIVFEFAQYFGNVGGSMQFIGTALLGQKQPDFASFYEKNETSVKKNIGKINEEYGFAD